MGLTVGTTSRIARLKIRQKSFHDDTRLRTLWWVLVGILPPVRRLGSIGLKNLQECQVSSLQR